MISHLSRRITDRLEENGTISKSNRELYEYGLRQMMLSFVNIGTTFLIGIAMSMILEAVIFTCAYIPLRIFAGGYHAKTPQRCWAISAIMLTFNLLVIKWFTYLNDWILVLSLIAFIGIFILSPVDNCSKPLDEIETKRYSLTSKIILFFELFILIISLVFDFHNISFCIELVWISLCLMLVVGMIKNKFYEM